MELFVTFITFVCHKNPSRIKNFLVASFINNIQSTFRKRSSMHMDEIEYSLKIEWPPIEIERRKAARKSTFQWKERLQQAKIFKSSKKKKNTKLK